MQYRYETVVVWPSELETALRKGGEIGMRLVTAISEKGLYLDTVRLFWEIPILPQNQYDGFGQEVA